MSVEKSLVSPRLAVLRQAVESGNVKAVDDFWEKVSEQGAPLIERIEADKDHSLVTFLWRAREISGSVQPAKSKRCVSNELGKTSEVSKVLYPNNIETISS